MRKALLLLATLLLLPLVGLAGVPSWQIMPDKSSLTFTATQNNAPVTGKFNTFSGDISVDPNQLNASHVRIIVDMGSVTSTYQDLTATLTSPEWFNVKIFPQAVFVSDKFVKTGDKTYQVSGMLTIRDKSIPVVLDVTQDEYSAQSPTARVHGNTILKRTAFGVGQGEWASTKEVKDDVRVDFTLVAMKK